MTRFWYECHKSSWCHIVSHLVFYVVIFEKENKKNLMGQKVKKTIHLLENQTHTLKVLLSRLCTEFDV